MQVLKIGPYFNHTFSFKPFLKSHYRSDTTNNDFLLIYCFFYSAEINTLSFI